MKDFKDTQRILEQAKDKQRALEQAKDTQRALEQIKENERFLDAIRGSLLGGAAGDALGYPVEFFRLADIRQSYGKEGITEYRLGRRGLARISDDTQMTLFTATGLLFGTTRSDLRGIGGYWPEYVRRAYKAWYRMQMGLETTEPTCTWLTDVPEMGEGRAPGMTCLSALGSGEMGSIENPLNDSKGCGGIMRVAPVGLYLSRHRDNPKDLKQADWIAAECAALTHGHPLGYMTAAALSHIVNRIVYGGLAIEAAVRDAIAAMAELFAGTRYLEDMLGLMEKALAFAENGASDEENIRALGGGWIAEETLAISIYCAVRYADDFSGAIIAAVNHDGDSDSTGAVTGNIVGAALGYEAIDGKWKENLECRDVILEVADDLCRDCQISEYSFYRDPAWERKYIYCRAYKGEE